MKNKRRSKTIVSSSGLFSIVDNIKYMSNDYSLV